jgi:hypothetical protein
MFSLQERAKEVRKKWFRTRQDLHTLKVHIDFVGGCGLINMCSLVHLDRAEPYSLHSSHYIICCVLNSRHFAVSDREKSQRIINVRTSLLIFILRVLLQNFMSFVHVKSKRNKCGELRRFFVVNPSREDRNSWGMKGEALGRLEIR